LQSLIKDESIPVIRGKQGSSQSVSVWNLVVGDVILLETGARVPADCLLIEGADLRVCRDESASETQLDDVS
jgi:magnesium-transporting ATPase (P-type)